MGTFNSGEGQLYFPVSKPLCDLNCELSLPFSEMEEDQGRHFFGIKPSVTAIKTSLEQKDATRSSLCLLEVVFSGVSEVCEKCLDKIFWCGSQNVVHVISKNPDSLPGTFLSLGI